MTPIDVIIRSQLDASGFQQATKFINEMGDAVKAGFGIAIGERILGTLKQIPETLIDAAKEGVKFNAAIEDASVGFETLLGNVSAAHQRVQELVEFSEKNPIFNFSEVEEADRALQTLTKGALATADGLKLVGDVSAGMHVPLTAAADLVGRFYGALDEGLPIQRSTLQMFHMGLISADTARHLEEVAKTGGGVGNAMQITQQTFAKTSGAMGKATDTFNGQVKELKTNIDALARSLTGGLTDGFKSFLTSLNKGIKEFNDDLNSEPLRSFLPLFGQSLLTGGNPVTMLAGAKAAVAGFPGKAGARTPSRSDFLNGSAESAGSAGAVGPRPLTQEQNQMLDELEGKATEAHRAGLNAMAALDQEYAAKKQEIDRLLGKNFEAWQEAMLDADQIFGRKRADLENDLEQKAYESFLDDEERRKQANAKFLHEQTQQEMDALRIKRDEISLQSAKLEASFGQTELEKRGQRIKLIKDEIEAIDTLIQKLTAERDAQTDPAAQQALNQQITSLAGEKRAAQAKLIPFTDGPSPTSFYDQWQKAIVEIRDSWGSAAQQMGQAVKTFVTSEVSSISQGIAHAIVVTGDFNAALRDIEISILEGIINAILQMGIQWVATQILMAVTGKTLAAAGVAASIPIAAAYAGVWATPATLATIATEGEAAAQAPFIMAGALAGGMAEALGGAGFKTGDYTGDGDPNEVAGLAHRGEFYFTAPQTRSLGVGNLRTMAKMANNWSGGSMAAAMGNGFGGGSQKIDNSVNIAPVMHPDAIGQWAQSTPGKKFIADIARGVVLEMNN